MTMDRNTLKNQVKRNLLNSLNLYLLNSSSNNNVFMFFTDYLTLLWDYPDRIPLFLIVFICLYFFFKRKS
jgi:hypothetical protein